MHDESHPDALASPHRRLILRGMLGAAVLVAGASLLHLPTSRAAEVAVKIAPPAFDAADPAGAQRAVAVFAGGCFWGVQAVFQHTEGVLQAVSGYAGGNQASANYSLVSGGMTEHAEAVQITYDPRKVSYGKLLQIFFSVVHDPTQLNRQGPDTGAQYRSAIFFAEPAAEAGRRALHRAARCGARLPGEDRHPARAAEGLLRRRGLPPGLRDAAPHPAVHRAVRPPEDREHAHDVPGVVPQGPGPGERDGTGRPQVLTRRAPFPVAVREARSAEPLAVRVQWTY